MDPAHDFPQAVVAAVGREERRVEPVDPRQAFNVVSVARIEHSAPRLEMGILVQSKLMRNDGRTHVTEEIVTPAAREHRAGGRKSRANSGSDGVVNEVATVERHEHVGVKEQVRQQIAEFLRRAGTPVYGHVQMASHGLHVGDVTELRGEVVVEREDALRPDHAGNDGSVQASHHDGGTAGAANPNRVGDHLAKLLNDLR